jgi:bile acid-coenzyme A ligase
MTDGPISIGRRLATLAESQPNAPAITLVHSDGAEEALTYKELFERANRVAQLFGERGAGDSRFVVIGLPNSLEHYLAAFGTWLSGACTLPVRGDLPAAEVKAIVELADPVLVVGSLPGIASSIGAAEINEAANTRPLVELPDLFPSPGKALTSGGSTGRPKIILDPNPLTFQPAILQRPEVGFHAGQVQLVAGPLYHNSPFTWSHRGLLSGNHVVLMEKFDTGLFLDLVEKYGVNYLNTVPTVMMRLLRDPSLSTRNLSTIEALFHTGAACPAWVKRAWIDLLGADKVIEGYGATENLGPTIIKGDAWLRHPGSVGLPGAETRILGEDGQIKPQGEVGEVYMRPKNGPTSTFRYIGAEPPPTTADGFLTLGDYGWLDEDGYLYIADRRVDMIITGGANVYPAEVEAVLTEHPGVQDAVVIGLPDEEWGRRVHAIVHPAEGSQPAEKELIAFVKERLASYKVPKSVELAQLPRDTSGKIRRSALLAERIPAEAAAR